MSQIHEETYERDGVVYQIRVIKEEGSMWGTWYCTVCEESGASSAASSQTIKEAVHWAKNNTGGHHWKRHSREKEEE